MRGKPMRLVLKEVLPHGATTLWLKASRWCYPGSFDPGPVTENRSAVRWPKTSTGHVITGQVLRPAFTD